MVTTVPRIWVAPTRWVANQALEPFLSSRIPARGSRFGAGFNSSPASLSAERSAWGTKLQQSGGSSRELRRTWQAGLGDRSYLQSRPTPRASVGGIWAPPTERVDHAHTRPGGECDLASVSRGRSVGHDGGQLGHPRRSDSSKTRPAKPPRAAVEMGLSMSHEQRPGDHLGPVAVDSMAASITRPPADCRPVVTPQLPGSPFGWILPPARRLSHPIRRTCRTAPERVVRRRGGITGPGWA
jgi:hypothetical protein